MGTAGVPSGKRVLLPRNMSLTWVLLRTDTALFAETTAMTSAFAAVMPKLSISARLDNTRRMRHSSMARDITAASAAGQALLARALLGRALLGWALLDSPVPAPLMPPEVSRAAPASRRPAPSTGA